MTTYTLAFHVCRLMGLGRFSVQRQTSGDSMSSSDGFLGCQAYRCRDYTEFAFIMARKGRDKAVYAAVTVEGSDGTRRFPCATDFITSSSPEAASPETARLVTSGSAEGGDPLSQLRALLADKPRRLADAAQALGMDRDALKDAIATNGDGILIKGPSSWLSLAS